MFQNNQIQAQRNANGNLIYVEGNNPQSVRRLCWSEENRLSAVADEDYVSHYLYDLDGERTMKLWGNTVPMDVNASENRFANFNEYTVYPSPYVVADVHGYTKHYYAGTERLCSRIGGGGLQELHYSPMDDGYVEKKENAYRNLINEDLRCAGARAETKELKFEMLHRLSEIEEPETKIYYYHSDHLGSASWITDSSGQAVQHMQYLPYGETKLDQRTSSYHERYTFTGKEKDSETGYYYFGARYYNSDLSLWLSVDPMSDKYPSLSPYNYCAWNPMKIVDPNGDTIVYSGSAEQQARLKGLVNQFKSRLPEKYAMLNESSNVYNVQYSQENRDESGGSFIYDNTTGFFNVNIRTNDDDIGINEYSEIEVLAHEFKHAEQYEKGLVGFKIINTTGLVIPYAYDQQDEIDAAIQANLFNPNTSNDYRTVSNIKNTTRSKYNQLPSRSIGVFEQNRKDLRQSNNSEIREMTIEQRNAKSINTRILYNKRKQ